MNKKFIFAASVILVVSFSAGIFTEIIAPSDHLTLAAELPSLTAGIRDYLRHDSLTVAAALIFSLCVFTMPAVALMAAGKTFSLGFSAAYLLSSCGDRGFAILFAALLPRGIFKIPAYIVLVILSYETAGFIRKNYRNRAALKKDVLRYLLKFLFCFLVMAASSILEVLLLQGVL